VLDVLASSINIMQVLITRSRLAGEPADVMVMPLLAHVGLMEFHRAAVAIDAGRAAVAAVLQQLQLRVNGTGEC
jgi:NTE family protein